MTLLNEVKELILAQGIVARVSILPETDVILDLNYKPADVAELFRMIQRLYKIEVNPEELSDYTRLDQITRYIQVNHPLMDPR